MDGSCGMFAREVVDDAGGWRAFRGGWYGAR
jgi:hypothetical protein